MANAPGVLVLIADDWSPLAACYGNDVIQTPNIDQLSERSVVFDNAFCTTPSCAASRASLLTGMHTHQHGQYGHCHSIHGFRTHERLADRTLPAVLGRGGVFTGLLGKDHIAPKTVYPFDVQDFGNAWSIDSLRTMARQFLSDAGARPFYLQVASMYPHRVGHHFDRNKCGDELRQSDVLYDPADVIVPDWLPDHPDVRGDLAAYYTFVSRYDRFCGAILGELERSGRAQDTLVICLSDHGMPFPGAKASMYDAGHRCPLLIQPPYGAGGRSDALVNWTDLYPTICEFFGLPQSSLPDALVGRSMMPILQGEQSDGWDQTFLSHCFHGIADYYPYRIVRNRRYKLIHNIASDLPMPLASDLYASPTWQAVLRDGLSDMGVRRTDAVLHHAPEELYDILRDPHETMNLIESPSCQSVAAELRATLQQFRESTLDPWLGRDAQNCRHQQVFGLRQDLCSSQ